MSEVGYIESVHLFAETMFEKFCDNGTGNHFLIVARDNEDSLCGCSGNPQAIAESLAGACLKDKRMKQIIIKAAGFIMANDLEGALNFFRGDDHDDE